MFEAGRGVEERKRSGINEDWFEKKKKVPD